MFPPDAIVLAASRWLRLLRSSTLAQASGIVWAGAAYADLTQTQYASGLEWLTSLGVLTKGRDGLELSPVFNGLAEEQMNQLLFQEALEGAAPAWLPDADVLVRGPDELPEDVAAMAVRLGLSERAAFMSVKQLHGRLDLAERARIGAAGERVLVELLESCWPGSTTHVALTDDGFGYDVLLRHGGGQWHLEVKSTTRRGRLVIYLSRHEHEVGLYDPCWRLVVVGLDAQLRLQAIATARHSQVLGRSPSDLCAEAKWQSVSHEVTSRDLERGCSFLGEAAGSRGSSANGFLSSGCAQGSRPFAWMP